MKYKNPRRNFRELVQQARNGHASEQPAKPPEKPTVVVARIAQHRWERTEVGTFLSRCAMASGNVNFIDDTVKVFSAAAARNMSVLRAREMGAKVLVQVDEDMVPAPNASWYVRAVDYLIRNPLTVYASPYRDEFGNVKVIDYADGVLKDIAPEDAFGRKGVEQVAACGTGLIAYGMDVFKKLEEMGELPWFDYEFEGDPYCAKMTSTEDVYFTRNCTLAEIPVLVDWECWSGHAKEVVMAKPTPQQQPQPGPVKGDPFRELVNKLQQESGKPFGDCRAALRETRGAYVPALEKLKT